MAKYLTELKKGDISFFDKMRCGFEWKSDVDIASMQNKINYQWVTATSLNHPSVGGNASDAPKRAIHMHPGNNIKKYLGSGVPVAPTRNTWSTNDFGKETIIIAVHNVDPSGAAGIKIPTSEIKKDHPVIINTGYMGGCCVLFGYDSKKKDFYCLHTGGQSFSTRKEGIVLLNKAYKNLKQGPSAPQKNCGARSCNYGWLTEIGDDIGRAVCYYLGKPHENRSECNVSSTGNTSMFNYYQNVNNRSGRAYALLYRKNPFEIGIKVYCSIDGDSLSPNVGNSIKSTGFILF
jgi:hypothetical protein